MIKPAGSLPTIVFIPHFGGQALSLARHVEWVQTLGFPTSVAKLSFDLSELRGVDVSGLWASELHRALDAAVGDKIIYSFSFPSLSVPALLSAQPRTDVRAWVCDGGPFLHLWHSLWNYFTYERPVRNSLLRAFRTTLVFLYFDGFRFPKRVALWLGFLSRSLPILSVREGRDRLVSEAAISAFFARGSGLIRLQTLTLPEAGHLEGLKISPKRYKTEVGAFLLSH